MENMATCTTKSQAPRQRVEEEIVSLYHLLKMIYCDGDDSSDQLI